MSLSPEQQKIIETIQQDSCHLLKIKAVAGSGKTFTLKEVATALRANPKTCLYTAFQKAVITEGKEKLSKLVECRTLHSLAYKYVYSQFKTEIQSNLEERSLPSTIPSEDKQIAIDAVERFFSSSSLDYSFFDDLKEKHAMLATNIIEGMIDGKYPITFNFLLKYFHLCLADGSITVPEFDLLMLDEAGDTTPVILEIFLLLRAKKKVMAGDPQQNIYTFMHTINGFEQLKNEGTTLTLSKSYRVNSIIAKSIETFVQANLDRTMQFKGIKVEGKPKNIAYISSTNAVLIDRMFQLVDDDKNFQLLRSAKDIFAYPLALMTASSGRKVLPKRFDYLNKEYKEFQELQNSQLYEKISFFQFLKLKYPTDVPLQITITLLSRHKHNDIYSLYKIVQNRHLNKADIILATAHTSKGMTFDSVYIEDDLNKATIMAQEDNSTEESLTTLRLAYTAVTRARLAIYNCKFLNLPDFPIDIYLK